MGNDNKKRNFPSLTVFLSLIQKISEEDTKILGDSFLEKEPGEESVGKLSDEDFKKIFFLKNRRMEFVKKIEKDLENPQIKSDEKESLSEKLEFNKDLIAMCGAFLEVYLKRTVEIDIKNVVFKKGWEIFLIPAEENETIEKTDEVHLFIDTMDAPSN